ncbi:hypothetical protein EVG20_g3684 [Dentipellis fragilis]|uniref:DRBM domain-containing protein n=1 Tax=Dentipellis fragilis TaxID=205917 RepID=A0A4Y9Z425_9AGAM|nr:hypothetical protein EVG20_g3684 [Dentipellis fragilis]
MFIAAKGTSSALPGPSLKRPRREPTMADSLPPIPSLNSDLYSVVSTHKSLRMEDENDECGSAERLGVLGKRVLAQAVATACFRKKPLLSAVDLETLIDERLAIDTIDTWVTKYELRKKFICPPDFPPNLFYPYVGAVYAQHGAQAVQNWIGKLVDPDFEQEDPTSKRFKSADAQSPSQPPPPLEPAPPLPQAAHPNPLTPAQPSTAFLPIFNQTAMQRRLLVTWQAASTGPPHAPAWSAECIVDGIVKGRGTGRSKQLAKEEAARQAFYNMGWAGNP